MINVSVDLHNVWDANIWHAYASLISRPMSFKYTFAPQSGPVMSLYTQRGVSAQKEDVHKATEKLDKGLYPNAFCKLYPDYLGADAGWVNVMHADGAGTKSIL